MMWHKCKFCGKEFFSDISKDIFCTPTCRKKYLEEYRLTYRKKNREKIAKLQHKIYLRKKAERSKNENRSC